MPTYRADHVGSFLRPSDLLEARLAQSEERIGEAQLREVEDQAAGNEISWDDQRRKLELIVETARVAWAH